MYDFTKEEKPWPIHGCIFLRPHASLFLFINLQTKLSCFSSHELISLCSIYMYVYLETESQIFHPSQSHSMLISTCKIQNTLPCLCPPSFHVASSLLYIYSVLSLTVSCHALVSWRANPKYATWRCKLQHTWWNVCMCVVLLFWPLETWEII